MFTSGGATLGKRAMGNFGILSTPNRIIKIAITHAKTGRRIKN
jgi:hypothetical protein